MSDDNAFDNIIGSMGGTPSPMMPAPPPPSNSERLIASLKVLFASIAVFALQAVTIALAIMVIHSTIVEEYGFAIQGIGFLPSFLMAVMAILAGSSFRKSTA